MASNPTISGTLTTAISEGSAATYSRTGSLVFSDLDAASVLTPSAAAATLLYKSSTGVDQTALLGASQVSSLVSALSLDLAPSYSSGGSVVWKYALADSLLEFLGASETVTVTLPLTVTDQTGLSATQNIIVTLRGTNDAPTLAATSAADTSASFSEAANTFGSTTTYSAQGVLKLADLDLTDTHTVSIAPKATGYFGGLTAVLVDTAAGNPGTVTWTYSAQDKALEGLADGQTVNQVYTITVTDRKGGTITQDVTITLTGAEDIPVVTGTTSGAISEGAAASYNLTGTLTINDADLTDRPVVSILSQDFSYKNSAGIDVTAGLPQAIIDQLKGAFNIPLGTLASNKGTAAWTYSIADSAIDFMGRSETVTLKTTVQVDDQHGGVVTRDVIVTLRGVNDLVTFKDVGPGSPSISASVVESQAVTGSAATDVATGVLSFVDNDISDKHVVTVAAQGTGYIGKFATTLSDTNGGNTGAVNWSYSVADKALDYLAQGETLTQTYRVSVTDSKGSTALQDITLVNVGTDDAAIVTGTSHATYYEALDSSNAGPITLDGTLKIADADASDVVSVSTSTVQISLYDDNGVNLSSLPADQLTSAQASMLQQAQTLGTYLTVNSSSAANAGQVNWSYAVTPDKIAFLEAGYHIKIQTDATVTSTHANGGQASVVTQPIVVDLIGTNTTFQAKDYAAQVVDHSFLTSLPANLSLGNQVPVEDLRSYKTLTAADGINFRSTITVEVTKDGAVFDGIDFRNVQVSVVANNVKFINCIFNATTDIYASIRTSPGTTGLVVDHSTFDGQKVSAIFQDFILSQGSNATITNNIFVNAPGDAIAIMGGTISGNYFHGGGYYAAAHSDAIWVGKTYSPVVISNNIIDWREPDDAPGGTNNAIRVSSELGDIDHVTIKDNVLLGGNYTITVTNGPTWTNTAEQMGKLTNVVIQGNIIDLGRTGEYDTQYVPKDTIYTGNQALWGTGTHFGDAQSAGVLSVDGYRAAIGTVFNDYVFGSSGSDYIVGGAGQDVIFGGEGNDIIQGGAGRDFLYGGSGADIFLFKYQSDGADNIRDFQQGVDKIDISALAGLSAADWTWADTNRFTGTPLQIRYATNNSGVTSLYVDLNGDTISDFRIDLTGIYTLTMSDLIVHRPPAAADPDGYAFSDSNLDLTASVASFSFSFASAPIVVINGQVALVHADGTLLPISELNTYTFSDGTIVNNDGNTAVDDLFYYAKYKAVWTSGIDADTHYATTGWQLGYDPNYYFSTNGYVAAHQAAAGVNPLEYYKTIGWKLGDDPNANFDTKLYVLMNPDVLLSGLDPLEHYLSIGRLQGRTIYSAIGDTIVNGFDQEYYLLANPAVASSGMSAMDHYLTIGWKLGLRPNAYFDPTYYISHNADVALSGEEPLTHFMSIGWQEGRDPGPMFDVSSYLAANPDVAASGVNPLTHFLTVGIYEGRLSFQAGVDFVGSAPVAVNDAAAADALIGTTISSPASVLANDSDADLYKLKVVSVNGSVGNLATSVYGSYGTLVLNGDGTYSYAVTSATGATGSHLVDHFKYVIADGKGGFNSASLDITLNRAAVASDDSAIAKAGAAGLLLAVTAANGVLANDKDADGDLLQIVSVGGSADGVGTLIHGQYGDLQLNADGSYTYVQNGLAPPGGGVTDTFTYSVADGYGSTSNAQLVINLSSMNTAPTLTGGTTSAIVESSASSYALTGKLAFSDADANDALTVSVGGQTVSLTDPNGVDISATLTADQIAKITAAFSVPTGQVGTAGSLDWTYQLADSAIHFLAAGEVVTFVTRVQVRDLNNEVSFQDVTIKITGTNDKPVFDTVNLRDPNVYMTLSEVALETGSANSQSRFGALYFTDLDAHDVHSVSVIMKGAGYLGTMTAQVVQEPSDAGGGVVMTNFSIPDKRFDALAANQTVTQTYTISVTDSKGAVTKQDVTVVLTGAEDLPTISGTSKLSWVEGQAASYTKTGSLTFSDVDLTDRLTTSIGAQSIVLKAADGSDITSYISDSQATLLKNAFTMPTGDLGKNIGTSAWTYAINDSALDFLGENDVLTVNTTVQVDDGMGGTASQVVSVSVRGINDAPTVKAYVSGDAAIAATVNELADVNGKTTLDTASGNFTFKDADLSDKHTVSVKAAGTGYIGTLTANVSTDTTGGKDGAVSWSFSAQDKALDFLTAGQTVTQTYTISISDGKSGVVKQDVTITLTGASEQFLFAGPTAQTINNFTPNADKLAFVSSAFGNYAPGTLDPSHFVTGTAATTDTSAQFVYDATKGKLFYDADGIGSGAQVLVATLNGNPALHFNDLLIV